MNELPLVTLLLIVMVAAVVGMLIGSVGIGGILLVPALIYLAGVDIHIAIASAMFSYAFSGLAGAWSYARHGSIEWQSGFYLCAGAMPGAWLGATLVNLLASDWVVLIIASFVAFAAYNSIREEQSQDKKSTKDTENHDTSNSNFSTVRLNKPFPLILIGLITGLGSALSGSGGPLVLVPILVWLKWPVLAAVGLGQLIQLPISLLADVANARSGTIDLPLGICIAVTMTAGVLLGAHIAHRQPARLLRKAVIAALLLAAGWMIFHSVSGLISTV